jgi:cytochrome c oxidase assembly protein subunit 15
MNAPSTTAISQLNPPIGGSQRALGLWLLTVCGAIAVMVAIGGVTRLTGSGLSITDWRPITGTLPPLTGDHWQSEFEKYMGSPQHRLVFPNMTVEEFKGIYWWEWIHRFWGRVIGVIYAVPLLVFWVRRSIPQGWHLRLLLGLALGGAQGVLGWFMVQSGLVDRPSVSAYRLAAHLGLAVFIFALLFHWALGLLIPASAKESARLTALNRGLPVFLGLLGLQILYGGFVAGTKAAMAYPTFPGLGGGIWPAAATWMEPAWRNFFENTAWVAFIHRWLGTGLFVLGSSLGVYAAVRHSGWIRRTGAVLIALLGLQVLLGIVTTLKSVGHIPVLWGTVHQVNALGVLAVTLVMLRLNRSRT